MLKMLAAYL